MFDFSTISVVALSQGEHESPSAGLCFMEMTAWFAGEAHTDKPLCACPVLAAYGIRLNDSMPHAVRNSLLLPMVPLIVGTRGTRADECARGAFLAMWATNKVLPLALRAAGLHEHADRCASAADLGRAHAAAVAATAAAANADAATYAANATYAAHAAAANAHAAAHAATYAANAAKGAAQAATDANVWSIAVEGLRQAIVIGPHEGLTLDPRERYAALVEALA